MKTVDELMADYGAGSRIGALSLPQLRARANAATAAGGGGIPPEPVLQSRQGRALQNASVLARGLVRSASLPGANGGGGGEGIGNGTAGYSGMPLRNKSGALRAAQAMRQR